MAQFEIVLRDRTTEVVRGADVYAQEGPMTTFFERDPGRSVIDCWSTRVASVRTADILLIRRADVTETTGGGGQAGGKRSSAPLSKTSAPRSATTTSAPGRWAERPAMTASHRPS